MGTTDGGRRGRVAGWVLVALAVAALAAVAANWWSRPAQMGADDRVFATVDALYTAVRVRDEKQVGACEARLHAYRDEGALPAAAAADLDRVIADARGGRWQPAAERLYAFMSAQRRDGEIKPHEKPKPAPKRK